MAEDNQDPLSVPMDQVMTKDGVDPKGSEPKNSEPKGETGPRETGATPRIEGRHTRETVDPAERLPEEPEEQNDLA